MCLCMCEMTKVFISEHFGFPGGSDCKESAAMQETWVQSLGWEDTPGEEKGYPLQYSGLENSMDCTVHGGSQSQTRLSDFHFQEYLP